MARAASVAVLLALALAAAGRAVAQAPEPGGLRYSPAANTFQCDLPGPDWRAFEEEEPSGPAVHLLGPDNPAGTYRAGISIRYFEKGQPGWYPLKEAIDRMRRSDKSSGRHATAPRMLRIGGVLSRIFEITEDRRLPADQLPSFEESLHHYVAVVPAGENYHVIKLSSSRDVYLDYRAPFVSFLKSFRPLGYR